MRFLLKIIFILIAANTLKANDTIRINSNQVFIDSKNRLIVTNENIDSINSKWPNLKTHVFLNEACIFTSPISNIKKGEKYTIYIPSKNSNYSVYFSELPIVSINTDKTIIDETNVLANFKMVESNQNLIESFIGIQYRGAYSQSLPKKSMEIEFWTDNTGVNKKDYSLLGMTTTDGWNLQAMYNEPLRIRSKTNNDLWRMINTLHYKDKEPNALNGIIMKYVELFLNNEYRGLYCLGEKVNRKQLKLKKYDGTIRGELYKGYSWEPGSTFYAVSPFNNESLTWNGFEYKHPNEAINWSNLYNLIDFAANSSDEDFFNNYQNYFVLDNLVDYYIFLNLLRATDNTGKNTYIAKYNKNDKYFYVPWDLDGSFGTIWDGSKDFTYNDLLSNKLYDRLFYDYKQDGFREKLKKKWFSLRSTFIKHDALMLLFNSNHNYLLNNGIYNREALIWQEYNYDIGNLEYMSNWIDNRLNYLDSKFTENILSVEKTDNKKESIKIFPNPTHSFFQISNITKKTKITILDNTGKNVLEKEISPAENINIEGLQNGLYLVKIENSVFKLIKK